MMNPVETYFDANFENLAFVSMSTRASLTLCMLGSQVVNFINRANGSEK